MVSNSERRALQRLEIPGSLACYKKEKNIPILNRYSELMDLKNLSKSGVCLQIKNGIKKGDRLLLQLVLPGDYKIELKGQVRWKSGTAGDFNEVGIQFEPFGAGRSLNSLSSLEKLRTISNQYDQ